MVHNPCIGARYTEVRYIREVKNDIAANGKWKKVPLILFSFPLILDFWCLP